MFILDATTGGFELTRNGESIASLDATGRRHDDITGCRMMRQWLACLRSGVGVLALPAELADRTLQNHGLLMRLATAFLPSRFTIEPAVSDYSLPDCWSFSRYNPAL